MSIQRPKGFLQFTPFIKEDDESEEITFINESNSQNIENICKYYLPFYEIHDEEDPVIVCPELVKSSEKNEFSALDWPQFFGISRVGPNQYIMTGGVQMKTDYYPFLNEKFNAQKKANEEIEQLNNYKNLINQYLENKQDNESSKQQVLRLESELSKKYPNVNFKSIEEAKKSLQTEKKNIQNSIKILKSKTENHKIQIDKRYCDQAGICFDEQELNKEKQTEEIKEGNEENKEQSEKELFLKDSPYLASTIQINIQLDEESEQYEFNAIYLQSMPISRSHHQSVFHNNILYVIGGVSNHNIINDCSSFDLQNNQWIQLPSMNIPRSDFSAVSHGKFIYVYGGFSKMFTENYNELSFEKYNPEGELWEQIEVKKSLDKTKITRAGSLISINEQIYLFGGIYLQDNIDNKQILSSEDLPKSAIIKLNIDDSTNICKYKEIKDLKVVQRYGQVIGKNKYQNDDCLFVFGGSPYQVLECFKIEKEANKPELTRAFVNDYTEELQEYYSFIQPTLYVD
ncbi:kelch motif family protein, putative [Ichthyophthirius multifiliis]|uniref:Kelch motif family protein, putative n=1 Tax=Ichthyophthirius multifiliis TaxID=5932 RepID=G0QXW8_ICHMU|nr:kelch motif family protein, putative [Ichthyophthirius multifiliis]EGR29920.1 kelch motif family protein, putative [Ichthyophthirius multifiliis]|eukprot:XP_004031156.1 kelch motif family protein, putative [Ichthyophthirius multifiliis]